jgi:hypothetical protein
LAPHRDATRTVTAAHLAEIERRVVAAMIATFGLNISAVALDMTNFATYIDSGNDKASLAQRGKAKQKRADLRLVGLGLVITRDGAIPPTYGQPASATSPRYHPQTTPTCWPCPHDPAAGSTRHASRV